MTAEITITGGCLCGALRYRATGHPLHTTVCHCANCRRASGAQSVAWLTFPVERFTFVQGEPSRYRTDTRAVRAFCGQCGSPLTYQNDDRLQEIDVNTGTADDPEPFPPTKDIFPEDRISWVPLAAPKEN
jgi:hypothetical protein